MKKYLIADVLTASRLVIAIAMLVLTFCGASTEAILWLFVVGELTDALDGPAARRWRHPERLERTLWRRYIVAIDKVADVLLGIIVLLYLTLRVNKAVGSFLLTVSLIVGISVQIVVFVSSCFTKKKERRLQELLAKIPIQYRDSRETTDIGIAYMRSSIQSVHRAIEWIILTRRLFYVIEIAVVVVILLMATSYSALSKAIMLVIGVIAAAVTANLKRNRLTEV